MKAYIKRRTRPCQSALSKSEQLKNISQYFEVHLGHCKKMLRVGLTVLVSEKYNKTFLSETIGTC